MRPVFSIQRQLDDIKAAAGNDMLQDAEKVIYKNTAAARPAKPAKAATAVVSAPDPALVVAAAPPPAVSSGVLLSPAIVLDIWRMN